MNRSTAFILVLVLAAAGMTGCAKSGDKLDMNPPSVVSMTPAADASDVALNTLVTFTFDKEVSGVSQSSVVLNAINSPSVPVNADITYDESTRTVTIKPKNSLAIDTYYVVAVNSDIRSMTGVSLDATSWVFTTGQATDMLSPTITAVTPAADSSFVDPDAKINVTFSEAILGTTVMADGTAAGSFRLKNIKTSNYVACTASYNEGSHIAVLKPLADLDDWTNYQVELTGNITDTAGNALAGSTGFPLVYSFMTDDQNSPIVKNKYPTASSGVARSAQVTVTFSESVSSSTVLSSANFYLQNDSTGQLVPAVLSYDDSVKNAILTPATALDASTTYYVYLTNSITDAAGNGLSSMNWSFTTGTDVSDTVAPHVLGSMTPQPDAVNVDPDTTISVTFSEDVTGVGAGTFMLKAEGSGTPLEAKIVYSESTNVATLAPKNSLAQNTLYTVELTPSIKDISGNALIERSWSFTTADNTKPTIISKIPGLEGNIAIGAPVYVKFSESVQSATVTDSADFKIEDVTGSVSSSVSGSVSYNETDNSAVFIPSSVFSYSSTYKVTISGVKDIAGNSIVTTTWTFVTLSQPDTEPPTVESVSPSVSAAGVGISSQISFVFSETVAAGCINANTARLHIGADTTGAVVGAVSVSYNTGTRQATILPDSKLLNSQTYTVEVLGNVAGSKIVDLSGNQLLNTSWSFTTEADTTAPTVVYRSPETGTTGIAGNGVQVDVGFSEPVFGVSAASFYIARTTADHTIPAADDVLGYVPSIVVTDISNAATNNYKYRLSLSSPVPDTKAGMYAIVLSSSIVDAAGNSVSFAANSWSIGVKGEDLTVPTVTLKDPDPLINQIWRRSSGVYSTRVIFSETVNGVDPSSFLLERKTGTTTYETVPCDFSYVTGTRTGSLSIQSYYVTANGNLYDTTFRLTLKNTIADTAGNAFAGDQWMITTDTDTDPPTIESVNPSSGSSVSYDVSGHGPVITATFSEKIAAASVTDSNFYLTKLGDSSHVPATLEVDGNILSLTPTAALAPSTSSSAPQYYVVTVTTGVTDKAVSANSLTTSKSWSFKTSVKLDDVQPYIVSITPANNAGSIGDAPVCSVAFSENMLNANSSFIWLADSSGSVVSTSFDWNSATKTATLTPNSRLAGGSAYYVVCSGNLTDLTGTNSLDVSSPGALYSVDGGNAQAVFTTASDTTGPKCTISYSDGAALALMSGGETLSVLNPEFTVVFDEAVTNVSASTITLTRSGTSVPTYVTYDSNSHVATVQLRTTSGTEVVNGSLKASTAYIVTVLSTVADAAGNALNKPISGTTSSDTSRAFTTPASFPAVSSVSFDATTVSYNSTTAPYNPSQISVTFTTPNDTAALSGMNPDKVWVELYTADTQAGHAVPVTLGKRVWSNGNKTITFPVVGSFTGGTTYYMRFFGWAGSFEDAHGTAIDRSTYLTSGVLKFTTTADSTKPTLISHIPATGVSVGTSLPVVALTFSEPMNTATVGSLSFTSGTGTLTLSGWMDGGRTVLYTVSGLAAGAHVLQYSGFADLKSNVITTSTFNFSVTSSSLYSSVTGSDENFDTGGFTNYANYDLDSSFLDGASSVGCEWVTATSGNFQSYTTSKFTSFDGAYLALAADCTWDYGKYADLISNSSSLDLSSGGCILLSFAMAHTCEYNQNDRLCIDISTDGGSTYTTYGTVYRYDCSIGLSPATRWKTHYVDISTAGSSSAMIRLRAYSSGETGANVYADKFTVTRY
jgi:hypothetical protein